MVQTHMYNTMMSHNAFAPCANGDTSCMHAVSLILDAILASIIILSLALRLPLLVLVVMVILLVGEKVNMPNTRVSV